MTPVRHIAKRGAIRMAIYPKDVEILTGKRSRTACRLLKSIREALNKAKHQCITVAEFCNYMGLEEELVREYLSD